jgi:hypothetical protein
MQFFASTGEKLQNVTVCRGWIFAYFVGLYSSAFGN